MPAAAFGRLCVETQTPSNQAQLLLAAAFGRLCVETSQVDNLLQDCLRSRLRAAVC